MKKLFASILMILYLVPSVGVTVSAHFCGGELMTVAYSDKKENKCFCGNKKMQKGCCEDTHVTLKMDDSHQKTELLAPKFVSALAILPSLPVETRTLPFTVESIDRVSYDLFHPPNLYKNPLYLLNRVFRI